jgi:uncharacterized protein (TIGR02757 family)
VRREGSLFSVVRNLPIKTNSLEHFYRSEQQSFGPLLNHDPLSFVHRYESIQDREVAGFLASQFAYGNIKAMRVFLEVLFRAMKGGPALFVRQGDFSTLGGLYYRFQKGEDIIALFTALRCMADDFGGLGETMRRFYDGDIRESLWQIRDYLFGSSDELAFFFPKRLPASPLKRWNLFLRWMVRSDEIDLGIWDFIDPSRLVVPLDTHIFKIGICQGWTSKKSPSWKTAQEITEALKRFSPQDPLKYDFLLCHCVGIGSGCTGQRTDACVRRCPLLQFGVRRKERSGETENGRNGEQRLESTDPGREEPFRFSEPEELFAIRAFEHGLGTHL